MVSSRRNLHIYITDDLRQRLEAAANSASMSCSQYVRWIVEQWLDDPLGSPKIRILKQLDFLELATDALLKHHPNGELRSVVHNTHKNRLQRRQAQEDVR